MEASTLLSRRALAYVIQYQQSPSRGEGRNVAIALVAEDGGYGAVRHLPPSQLADRLRERGILDSALVALARTIASGDDASRRLDVIRALGTGSLLIGDPLPTDIGSEPDRVLASLFQALVARPYARRGGHTKADVLDRAVATFRRAGTPVRVGLYVGDFLLDALVEPTDKAAVVVHAQSFDGSRKDWTRMEHEAGHFLYAVEQIRREAICVMQPPQVQSSDAAHASFERVSRWCANAGVSVTTTPGLPTLAARFEGREQLPLFMSA